MTTIKSLTLTKEQQDKLEEMIRVLFKEENVDESAFPGMLAFKKENYGYEMIHWFEFCMTHLIKLMESKLPFFGEQQPYYIQLMMAVFYGCNPVDWLYDKYSLYLAPPGKRRVNP